MNYNESAINTLIEGIVRCINKKINLAKFNRGVTGRVTQRIDNNEYYVRINGKIYTAKSRFELNVNDIVKIIVFNNNLNELYIIY